MKTLRLDAAFTDLMRPLDAQEYAILRDSMKTRPECIPPIVVWEDGIKNDTIVDGRHRYEAAAELKVDIPIVYIPFKTLEEAQAWCIDSQRGRRNLPPGLLAQLALRLTKLQGITQQQAAQALGVSVATITRTAKVAENAAPEVVKAVAAGDVTVRDAAAVSELTAEQQIKALALVETGQAQTLREASREVTKRPRKTKQGREKVPTPHRKAAMVAFSRLVRALERLALNDNEKVRAAMTVVLNVIKRA
jgi:ParB-like chromosome segregation protein Spo0J